MTALDNLNSADVSSATALLRPVCASTSWLAIVLARRPFPSVAALQDVAGAAIRALPWAGIREAVDAHPRIGDRVPGAGIEAAWSRQEQSSATTMNDDVSQRLVKGNIQYERRFGHVFLICATGLDAEQMLSSLHDRLGNDEELERAVVRGELAEIVRLRLDKVFDSHREAGATAREKS